MAMIAFEAGDICVDAQVIAEGLGLRPAEVHEGMRAGWITSRCERGIDADQGRFRLTFFSRSKRLRLVVDEAGQIIQRSGVDFGKEPLPAAMRWHRT